MNFQADDANPLISVIIPVFNAEAYVQEALDSVINDQYNPREIIVVDDGSDDGSPEKVRQYREITLLQQKHLGVSAARNKAIDISTGEMLTFLDADDIWIEGRFAVTADFFKNHADVGYILGKQTMFLEPGYSKPPFIEQEWLDHPQEASNTGALAVRKEVFKQIGQFDTSYESGEDTEWLARANGAGIKSARIPQILQHKRVHAGNLSTLTILNRKRDLMRIAREAMLKKRIRKVQDTKIQIPQN